MSKYKHLNKPYPVNLYLTIIDGMEQIQDKTIPNDLENNINIALSNLTEREEDCVRLYFRDGMTYDEIGEIFCLVHQRIAQITRGAIRKLRNPDNLYIILNGNRPNMDFLKGIEGSLLDISISDIGLSDKTIELLNAENIMTIGNLLMLSRSTIEHIDYMGYNRLIEIEKALAAMGLFIIDDDNGPIKDSDDILRLRLRKGSRTALRKNGINTIGQLTAYSAEGLMDKPGVGDLYINDIIQKLKNVGLELDKNSDSSINNNWDSSLKKDDPIEILNLSIRPQKALKRAKIETVNDLVSKSRYQLLSIANLGNKSLDEIIDVLGKYNLKLKGE